MIFRNTRMAKYLIIFLVFYAAMISCAQETTSLHLKNSVFVQIGGPGGLGSLNYERKIISREISGIFIRAGICTYHINDYENKVNPDVIAPILLNGYFGKKHKFEIGIGQTFSSTVRYNLITREKSRTTELSTVLQAGYRYQPLLSHFFIGIYYTPIFENNESLRHWGGFSVGYNF
jgi:hypothetical protein